MAPEIETTVKGRYGTLDRVVATRLRLTTPRTALTPARFLMMPLTPLPLRNPTLSPTGAIIIEPDRGPRKTGRRSEPPRKRQKARPAPPPKGRLREMGKVGVGHGQTLDKAEPLAPRLMAVVRGQRTTPR